MEMHTIEEEYEKTSEMKETFEENIDKEKFED